MTLYYFDVKIGKRNYKLMRHAKNKRTAITLLQNPTYKTNEKKPLRKDFKLISSYPAIKVGTYKTVMGDKVNIHRVEHKLNCDGADIPKVHGYVLVNNKPKHITWDQFGVAFGFGKKFDLIDFRQICTLYS